jgi:hypothetical protein
MSSNRAVAYKETGKVEVTGRDRVQIAKMVNPTALPVGDAPKGYAEFGAGAATQCVLNPTVYTN